MATIAKAWVLGNPVVTSPIVGAIQPHHLADVVAALGNTLTDDQVAALEGAYAYRKQTWFA